MRLSVTYYERSFIIVNGANTENHNICGRNTVLATRAHAIIVLKQHTRLTCSFAVFCLLSFLIFIVKSTEPAWTLYYNRLTMETCTEPAWTLYYNRLTMETCTEPAWTLYYNRLTMEICTEPAWTLYYNRLTMYSVVLNCKGGVELKGGGGRNFKL